MIKILYVGKNHFDIIDKIPKGEEYVILDSDEYKKHGDVDFIKYVDDERDLYDLSHSKLRLMIKKGLKYEECLLRDFLIVEDFKKALPPFKRIGLYGDKQLIINLLKFITKYYKCGFKVDAGSWMVEYLVDESILMEIGSYNGQISTDTDSLIELVLDDKHAEINIFLWNGDMEDIYKWKSEMRSGKNILISNKYFAVKKIRDKWNIKTYFMNKYNIKKIWKAICYDYNVL